MIFYELLIADRDADGSIRNWANNAKVPALTVLRQAEAWINARLRIRQMIRNVTGTLAEGASSIAVDDSLLAVDILKITAPYQLKLRAVSLDDLEDVRPRKPDGTLESGVPNGFTLAGAIELDLAADQALSWSLWGYYALAPLSAENPTNYLTDHALPLLMAVCCGYAAEYLRDWEDATAHFTHANGEVRRLNAVHGGMARNQHMAVRVE